MGRKLSANYICAIVVCRQHTTAGHSGESWRQRRHSTGRQGLRPGDPDHWRRHGCRRLLFLSILFQPYIISSPIMLDLGSEWNRSNRYKEGLREFGRVAELDFEVIRRWLARRISICSDLGKSPQYVHGCYCSVFVCLRGGWIEETG